MLIKKVNSLKNIADLVVLVNSSAEIKNTFLTKDQKEYIFSCLKKDASKNLFSINDSSRSLFIQIIEKKKTISSSLENARKLGAAFCKSVNANKVSEVFLDGSLMATDLLECFIEGLALANYEFSKYLKKAQNSLKTICVVSKRLTEKNIEELNILVDACYVARTLVNEPANYLTATQLAKEFEQLSKKGGFKLKVLSKKEIEAKKMGGLLAVNKGSLEPPSFSVLEWNPSKKINKKPFVLVGKGVVYDSGGLSLKPTLNSMDKMKSDMAGAAATTCALYAIAKAKLPIHVICLVPSTDNRIGEKAYAPGDVITMMDGTTVEVLNTDAEGRLILADALHYAKSYSPELVIDLATLTGAAAAAIGPLGIVSMGNSHEKYNNKLKESGENVYERIAEMPFWDEYGELIKSPIADIKNTGGSFAGAITAGKFLAHFTNYPWIHLDIAGPSFLDNDDKYYTKGGTGVGVRLLFNFFKKLSS